MDVLQGGEGNERGLTFCSTSLSPSVSNLLLLLFWILALVVSFHCFERPGAFQLGIGKFENLRRLCLTYNGIGIAGAKALFEAGKRAFPILEQLSVYGNRISTEVREDFLGRIQSEKKTVQRNKVGADQTGRKQTRGTPRVVLLATPSKSFLWDLGGLRGLAACGLSLGLPCLQPIFPTFFSITIDATAPGGRGGKTPQERRGYRVNRNM